MQQFEQWFDWLPTHSYYETHKNKTKITDDNREAVLPLPDTVRENLVSIDREHILTHFKNSENRRLLYVGLH